MTEFSRVQAGLNADIRERRIGAAEYRERGKRVLARVPKSCHQIAHVLLAHADENNMSEDEIVKTCLIAGKSLIGGEASAGVPLPQENPQPMSQQDLYNAGANAAMLLMGITPDTTVPPALSEQERPSFKLDENVYKAGEDAALNIMRLLGRRVGE